MCRHVNRSNMHHRISTENMTFIQIHKSMKEREVTLKNNINLGTWWHLIMYLSLCTHTCKQQAQISLPAAQTQTSLSWIVKSSIDQTDTETLGVASNLPVDQHCSSPDPHSQLLTGMLLPSNGQLASHCLLSHSVHDFRISLVINKPKITKET